MLSDNSGVLDGIFLFQYVVTRKQAELKSQFNQMFLQQRTISEELTSVASPDMTYTNVFLKCLFSTHNIQT